MLTRRSLSAGVGASLLAPVPATRAAAPFAWPGGAKAAVSLTYDDALDSQIANAVPALREAGFRATFFLTKDNVGEALDEWIQVARAGHEIGNHSQTHPNFAMTRPSFIGGEFAEAQRTIAQATGQVPVWLRAPFGVLWFGFRGMQRRLGLQGVMWTVLGRDWKLPAGAIAERVISRISDGGIICLHDGRGTLKDPDVTPTIEAVRRIVPNLLEKGYHFETVTQLLCPMKRSPTT